MNILKKIIISILLIFGLSFFLANSSNAWDFYGGEDLTNIYETTRNGLEEGIKQVKDTVSGIETEKSASEYIQQLVIYFLSFLSLVALIYIIYAGINIMVAGSDEEKLKGQKKTIIHVIIGIVVIRLAYSLVLTVFNWLDNKQTGGNNGGTTYTQSE